LMLVMEYELLKRAADLAKKMKQVGLVRNLDIPVPSRVLSGHASGRPAASVGMCVPILSPPGGS
jgi:hypothetical protein